MGRQDGSSRRVSAPDIDSSTAPILHVDLDAFFASATLLAHPELADRPVVIAHDSPRSVVTAANYPARRFGLRSAQPLARAKQLCPHVIVLDPDFPLYRRLSTEVMAILDDMTPLVERLGIDEAFLDVSGARLVLGSPAEVAKLIRRRVREETGLACSVGAAATKFVAKLASGLAKPDGLLVVPEADTLAVLHPLPVSALWGVGKVTEEALLQRHIRTIGEVAHADPKALRRALGEAGAAKLHDLAWGRDPRPVTTTRIEKSIGHEVTFDHDITDGAELRRELLRLSARVGSRMREGGIVARTIALKVRWDDFSTVTRSRTLEAPTDLGRRIYDEAAAALDGLEPLRPVRLIGVRGEQLSTAAASLLWDEDGAWREAERALDEVTRRFGTDAVTAAALLRDRGRERG